MLGGCHDSNVGGEQGKIWEKTEMDEVDVPTENDPGRPGNTAYLPKYVLGNSRLFSRELY